MRSVLPVLLAPVLLAAPAARAADDPPAFDRDVRPFVAKYCVECHGPKKKKGDLDLSVFADEAAVLKARPVWKTVWNKLYTREMPPEDFKPQPATAARDRVTAWIESALARLDGSTARDPGRVVIRRLNRAEYRHTVRDLLGVEVPVDDFPSDDVGYGFDNIGDVLSLPPLLMEKYLTAAEQALDLALVTDIRRAPPPKRYEAEKMIAADGSAVEKDRHVLAKNGEIGLEVEFAQDGRYVLRVSAGADAAGYSEPVRMAVRVDGAEAAAFDVRAPRSRPGAHEAKAAVKAGRRRVTIAFLNDKRKPGAPEPPKGARVRNLSADWLEVAGPIDLPPPELPETHKRIFTAAPGKDRRAAAKAILAPFVERAYRRPPAPHELERLLKLFDAADQRGDDFESAVALALEAVLVSPHFLFRLEPDVAADDPKGVRPVNDWELASRLSYFLWNTMPDAELFELARKGKLREPAALDGQILRLLKDPRAKAFAGSFAAQWLQLRRLEGHAPDGSKFPAFDDALRSAMLEEAVRFFDAVLQEDRSVLALLDADFTFLNERLAKHYGVAGVAGPEMRRVALTDPRRGGVMTMAGVLTATSTSQRTSPVKRGKWVLETILGAPPPPPLPGADNLKEEEKKEGAAKLSLRRRLELHRANPDCASCHQRMDPIGFGFENFDAIGAWRELDDGLPLDTAAVMPDGSSFQGPVELKALMLFRKDEFFRCLVEKMLTYALGRGIEYHDAVTVRGIVRALDEDPRLARLVIEVAKSYPFLHRRNKAAGGTE